MGVIVIPNKIRNKAFYLLLRSLKLTPADAASLSNVSISSIDKVLYERGDLKVSTLKKICKGLQVHILQLGIFL